jgi:hypothetical protein
MPESRRRENFSGASSDFDFALLLLGSGRPDMIGGGNSNPSFALRDS